MNTHQQSTGLHKRNLLLAALAAGVTVFCAQSQAQSVLLGYDFTGTGASGANTPATYNATTSNSQLDSSLALGRGSGAGASAGANSFRTTGFKNDGISTANTDYFTFSLSAAAGNTLSLSSISTIYNGTGSYLGTNGSPGATTQFAYSIDGSAYTLISSTNTVTAYGTAYSYDLTGVAALQNVADTSTVTFRFYASGQTTTGGFGFYSPSSGTDGLDINGNVAPVPEPATLLGGALLVGAAGWTQRRRLRGFTGSSQMIPVA